MKNRIFLLALFLPFFSLYGKDPFLAIQNDDIDGLKQAIKEQNILYSALVNEEGYSPLGFAILSGNVDAVELPLPWLSQSHRVKLLNHHFLAAVIRNQKKEVQAWLDAGASIFATTASHQTALMISCYADPTGSLTAWLLRKGAPYFPVDIAGKNALYYALVNQNWDAASMLSAYGLTISEDIKLDKVVSPIFLNRLNVAFIKAIEANHNLNQLELFRRMGAELNWQDGNGRTGLMVAALNLKSLVLVDWLLDKGADPTVKDRFGRDIISFLVDQPDQSLLLKRLVKGGALRPYQSRSYKILDKAMISPANERVILLLLKNISDFEARDRAKRTLLQNLFYYYDDFKASYIQLLVKFGANVNGLDRHGQSVLIYAVRFCSDAEMVGWLIKKGADLEYVNPMGRNALLAALESGSEEVILTLLKAGAKVDVALPDGTTAKQLFDTREVEKKSDYDEIIRYFSLS